MAGERVCPGCGERSRISVCVVAAGRPAAAGRGPRPVALSTTATLACGACRGVWRGRLAGARRAAGRYDGGSFVPDPPIEEP